jgi:hypothetical protein
MGWGDFWRTLYSSRNIPVNLDNVTEIVKGNTKGRAMAQAVSRRPLTAEARVRERVSPWGTCGRQSGTVTFLLWVLQFSPVNIIPPWLSILTNHLEDEQWARWWLQFRDTVSPHWLEQENIKREDFS